MKPISLTIEAFGPYRDSVTLDFNELQDHSMFLIAGPTGAGKTSILDAMVYALYGEPSGEVRKTDAIRSDFAEPHRMTRVDFSFAIGNAQYRVERLPKQRNVVQGCVSRMLVLLYMRRKMVSGRSLLPRLPPFAILFSKL